MGNWTRSNVLSNGTSQGRWSGVDFNVTNEQVFTLLESATESRNRELKEPAKNLLTQMSNNTWFVAAGSHEGGLGGGNHQPDPLPHITLRVNGQGHHLHYRVKDKKIILTSIT